MNAYCRSILIVAASFAWLTSAPPVRGDLLFEEMDPTVSYSAVRLVETEEIRTKMREVHAPGKKRFEMNADGSDVVMIHRDDTQKSWMLMPEMRRYMEISAGQVKRNAGGGIEVLEKTEMGKETVNGHPSVKYKAVFLDAEGRKGGGYFWVTERHGIPVRTDMIQTTAGGRQRIFMELSELEIAPQPQSLFELPSGYQPMPAGMGSAAWGAMAAKPSGSSAAGRPNQEEIERRIQEALAEAQGRPENAAESEKDGALEALTADYLAGCWWVVEGERGPWTFYPDGAYDVGVAAGDGFTMVRGGESVASFRGNYHRLESKTKSRFVVYRHHHRSVFERGECVSGTHGVAGSGSPSSGRDEGSASGNDGSSRNAVEEAADKVKRGFGSFFDKLKK